MICGKINSKRRGEEKADETLHLKVSLYDDLIVDIREVFEDMIKWD